MAIKLRNVFTQLKVFEDQIGLMEHKILELEMKIESLIKIERNHLIRVKNHEEVSDEFLSGGKKYQDLTPEKAWKLYCKKDFDFILLDVSSLDFRPERKLPEAQHIPWEIFKDHFFEIDSKTTPILIISEDGTKSILACEFLVKCGYYNCNNISGGYKHWKGFRVTEERSA